MGSKLLQASSQMGSILVGVMLLLLAIGLNIIGSVIAMIISLLRILTQACWWLYDSVDIGAIALSTLASRFMFLD